MCLCFWHTSTFLHIYKNILYFTCVIYSHKSNICIYSLVQASGTAQTWIRLVKLVQSVTKFRCGINKFHQGHYHQHHHHHHHHHHHIIINCCRKFTWMLTSSRKFTWTLTSHPTPPTPRVRSINCCRKFTWTLTSCPKFTWTSHPTPPPRACEASTAAASSHER